ncbi:putative ascorbate peroxidase [Hydra vulgaris]|uniref:putative ascorbate peroxidase n=1 Tax=Hydra vulgaris TaxID=6087 RepID=UPI0001926109|nr:putative ascorbate peroxidase [Hydra vulgaris]
MIKLVYFGTVIFLSTVHLIQILPLKELEVSNILKNLPLNIAQNKLQIIPSRKDFEQAKLDLANLIEKSRVGRDLTLIAGTVRLAFHDCVGEEHCDGCIEYTNPDNAGLDKIVQPIDNLYNNGYKGKMSRADFYALAAVIALTRSTADVKDKYQGLKNFKVGRKDCSTSPNENKPTKLPQGSSGYKETFNYFKNEFGFNVKDTVALLGAHTLGRCYSKNSGYQGVWDNDIFNKLGSNPTKLASTSVLDNSYYDMFIKIVPWIQVDLKSGKKQWQEIFFPTPNDQISNISNQHPILLNSDLVLSWEIEPKDKSGTSSCLLHPFITCKHSAGHKYAAEFAMNNALWLKAFTDVFNRMIEKNPYKLKAASTLK